MKESERLSPLDWLRGMPAQFEAEGIQRTLRGGVMFRRKQLKASRIPARWEDVTPQWMTAAIASRHPDATVGGVKIVTADEGSNRRARFSLDYAKGSGAKTVFLKAHAPAHCFVHFRKRQSVR